MDDERDVFDDRPLTKESLAEMRERAEKVLRELETKPESDDPPVAKARTFNEVRQTK